MTSEFSHGAKLDATMMVIIHLQILITTDDDAAKIHLKRLW